MTDAAQARRVLIANSDRVTEIVTTLGKYGFASWAEGVPDKYQPLLGRMADPNLAAMTDGERAVAVCTTLGTTFIKIAQILSTRADIVGEEVAAALASLQADVPADPPATVRATIETEIGAPIASRYASFDENALGSASIGQVHAATLLDGTEVVVKVQHAGIREVIETDLDIIEALAVLALNSNPELALYRPVEVAAQLRRSLLAEASFLLEARNLARFNENFADEPEVVIPEPYPELCSERLLTMSRMGGERLSDVIDEMGPDGETFVRTGADIYIKMIFRDGLFHADPHPGNLYVLAGGKVGLLDFGKVGRIDDDLQDVIDDMVVAALRHDVDGVVDGIVRVCDAPPTLDKKALRRDVADWIDQYTGVGFAGADMQGAANAGDEILRRHRLMLPPDVALLGRTLTQLQGLLVETGYDITITEVLQPYAGMIAAKRFAPRRIMREVQRTARGWEDLFETFPVEMTAILEGIRTGQLEVPFNIKHLDRNVNRLVYAALAASLFTGSARLWASRVPPRINDMSIPGALGTLLAANFAYRLLRSSKRAGGIG